MSEINNSSKLIRKTVLCQAGYLTLYWLGILSLGVGLTICIQIAFNYPIIIFPVTMIISALVSFCYSFHHPYDEDSDSGSGPLCLINRQLTQIYGQALIYGSQVMLLQLVTVDHLGVKVQFGLMIASSILLMASYFMVNRFRIYDAEFTKVYRFSMVWKTGV